MAATRKTPASASRTGAKTAAKARATPARKPAGQAAASKPAAASAVDFAAAGQAEPAAARRAAPKAGAPAAAPEGKAKPKLVRDSFTIPKAEYSVLAELKQRGIRLGHPVKKSELLRAGIAALQAMPDDALLSALRAVPSLKPGRPKDSGKH